MHKQYITTAVAAGLVSLSMTGLADRAAAEDSITIVSGGGAYGAAIEKALQEPFTEETGISVDTDDYDYSLGPIRAQVMADAVHWDVAVVEEHAAIRGCDEGLFVDIDHDDLPAAPDGTSARDDFFEGALPECGVGLVMWSQIYGYDKRRYPDEQPTTLQDFFDLERFPGTRGLLNRARGNLEFALMADGVAPEDVYDVLETSEGIDRAFAVLDDIKAETIFWEAGAQPPLLLADGEVAMTTAWNGRIQVAIDEEDQPFEIVWDGQLYNLDSLVILEGTQKLDAAMQFIHYAARPENLARMPEHIAYGPVRASAQDMVPDDIAVKLPTHPDNMETALAADDDFWAGHGDELEERFSTWMLR